MSYEARDKEQAKRYRWLLKQLRRTNNYFEPEKYTYEVKIPSNTLSPDETVANAMFRQKSG